MDTCQIDPVLRHLYSVLLSAHHAGSAVQVNDTCDLHVHVALESRLRPYLDPENFLIFDTVILSFLFDKYYLIKK